jgi:hypothetical protein
MLDVPSAIFLRSESHGTHDHVVLAHSQLWDSPGTMVDSISPYITGGCPDTNCCILSVHGSARLGICFRPCNGVIYRNILANSLATWKVRRNWCTHEVNTAVQLKEFGWPNVTQQMTSDCLLWMCLHRRQPVLQYTGLSPQYMGPVIVRSNCRGHGGSGLLGSLGFPCMLLTTDRYGCDSLILRTADTYCNLMSVWIRDVRVHWVPYSSERSCKLTVGRKYQVWHVLVRRNISSRATDW